MINVLGSSHISLFSGVNSFPSDNGDGRNVKDTLKDFRTWYTGAHLSYNLCNKEHPARKTFDACIDKLDRNTPVLLMMGEIDCRNHLVKQKNLKSVSSFDVVFECVEKCMEVVKDIKDEFSDLVVWGPHPILWEDSFNGVKESTLCCGSYEEICLIEYLFNSYFSLLCDKEGIKFATLYYLMMETFMNLEKKNYMIDQFHLSQEMLPYALDELKACGVKI